MTTNPTIDERVFYFDAEGKEDGTVNVASDVLFRQGVVQRVQLLNLSTTGRDLPSILPEYNRINVQYPRTHSVSVAQGDQTYTAAVAGPTRITSIAAQDYGSSPNVISPTRLECAAQHGLDFLPCAFGNFASGTTFSFPSTSIPNFIEQMGSYRLFFAAQSPANVFYSVGFRDAQLDGNNIEGNLSGSVSVPSPGRVSTHMVIAAPITGAMDGEIVGITAATSPVSLLDVNTATGLRDGAVPPNTFIALNSTNLLAFNYNGNTGTPAPAATLVQTAQFLEDAVGTLNTRLEARYGTSAPTLSVVNNALVGPDGSTVTSNTLERSEAIVTIPDYYYDNNFHILGGVMGSEMNRLFVSTTPEPNFSNSITINGRNITINAGKYSSPETFAQHLATQIGATYTVRVERTTGSTSYTNRDNPVSSTTPALDAAEDTKPTFRTQGLRAE